MRNGEVESADRGAAAFDAASAATTGNDPREWPVLDAAALYGLPGDIVRAIEPHTEADLVALLAQVLVYFGVICGRGPHVRVEGDRHCANLNVLLVGQSAKARKGTSLGRVKQAFEGVSDRPNVVSGLSSGEGLKYNVRDATNPKDPGAADKRLLVIESEFASVLRNTARHGNTLSATIREAFDSGNLRTLTKNDPVVATGAHIAIVGHITADELRAELTATDRANGFANRFVFLCVKRSKFLAFGGGEVDFAPLTSRLEGALQKARDLGEVKFTDDARARWALVYPVLSEGNPGLLGAVTARAEAITLRLALAYALMDKADAIDAPHLLAALALWEYAEASARYIFGAATGDAVADRILRALRHRGEAGLSRTDIGGMFNRHVPSECITMALDLLNSRDLAHSFLLPTLGRSVETWKAGPAQKAQKAQKVVGPGLANPLNALNAQRAGV